MTVGSWTHTVGQDSSSDLLKSHMQFSNYSESEGRTCTWETGKLKYQIESPIGSYGPYSKSRSKIRISSGLGTQIKIIRLPKDNNYRQALPEVGIQVNTFS